MLMLFPGVLVGTHDGGEDRRHQEKVSVYVTWEMAVAMVQW